MDSDEPTAHNETPFESPSLKRWIAWLFLAFIALSGVMVVLLFQLEPSMREAFLESWADSLQTPSYLLRIVMASLVVLVLSGMWYGIKSSMARNDLEDDPRVREAFKDRFVRGVLEPDTKVICADCGDIHDAVDIDCPECGASEIVAKSKTLENK